MSENPTPEPEAILLHADWSTTRHEQWEPDNGSHEHERVRREKMRREREWLLADMDPSPLIEQRRREREMNAQWDANREAEQRTLDRMHDQRDRPVSGEETNG